MYNITTSNDLEGGMKVNYLLDHCNSPQSVFVILN